MDSERKFVRHYFKHIDKTSLRKICAEAGFNEDETKAVVMFYGCMKSEDYIADHLGMSTDAYHKYKSLLIDRIRYYYHSRFPDTDAGAEMGRKVDEMLRKI